MSFRRCLLLSIAAASCGPKGGTTPPHPEPTPDAGPAARPDLRAPEETHLGSLTQLTFGGENAEAYWASGGDKLIFQTTREGVPCDQIMVMDAARASDPTLVSTGKGRTTCSYFFPGDAEILYASTHEKDAACPPPPDRSKGYVWALYDFDIYKAAADGTNPKKLFGVDGKYDAEATICAKDGSIIFTSDKDGDLELYKMNKDGGDVVRLTDAPGYDGGAFFNADCSKIVWRASRPTGDALADYQGLLKEHMVRPTKLEIWVADADGSDARQITYLDAASFAPFFHPSGNRVLFSSNHGDPKGREFDIWAVDVDGTDLERITSAPGFDGFPMFSPDGKRLAFSSNRGSPPPPPGSHGGSDTNVFVADWVEHEPRAVETGAADRTRRAVDYLAADAREGRGVGTQGLADATKWVEGELRSAGVEGGMASGAFRQEFEVTTALTRGAATQLTVDGKPVDGGTLGPSHVSMNGKASGKTVYVGFGIVDKSTKLDDYKGKSVRGKVVVVRRFAPKGVGAKEMELSDLNYKAGVARKRGAIGMVVVDLPEGDKKESPLPTLRPREGADAGLPILVTTRAVGEPLTVGVHDVAMEVELTPVKTKTENVVGVLRAAAEKKSDGVIVIGAHLDHLGMGGHGTGALDAENDVHNGADDNASGVAALLEAARILGARKGELARDVYFVAFSGEEMGLLGSNYFVAHPPYDGVAAAMLNMDMVGRLRDNIVQVLGAESASEWATVVEPLCTKWRVVCHLAGSGYGPSDHMAFYMGGSPVVHFFTGGHLQYHRVSDDAPTVNAVGMARVAGLVADTALALAVAPKLTYKKVPPPPKMGDIPLRGASLGTIPAYGDEGKVAGVLISDVVPGGAAQKAGLEAGDRIVKIGVTDVRNVQDLMLVLGEAVPGQDTVVIYLRDGKKLTAKATFGEPRARH
ncbi:MAG TPA: M20/M25/M40 family metallo-hydrolase [Kofleriaceae bacterium]|nr:M20/M25/M40 family metallo-hydrolase [Kofleriaceae bacterium]